MVEEVKIKPCPFCGKDGSIGILHGGPNRTSYFGHCVNCECTLQDVGGYENRIDAINEWNTRTDPIPSVANTCPKCGGKSHAMYSDDLLECAANHWKRNEDRALAAAKDGATGEGEQAWRNDPALGYAALMTCRDQLAAAKAEIAHLKKIIGTAMLVGDDKDAEIERLTDENLGLMIKAFDYPSPADIRARDAVLAQCESALKRMNIKADGIVGSTADYLIIRVPVEAFQDASEALSAIAGLKVDT